MLHLDHEVHGRNMFSSVAGICSTAPSGFPPFDGEIPVFGYVQRGQRGKQGVFQDEELPPGKVRLLENGDVRGVRPEELVERAVLDGRFEPFFQALGEGGVLLVYEKIGWGGIVEHQRRFHDQVLVRVPDHFVPRFVHAPREEIEPLHLEHVEQAGVGGRGRHVEAVRLENGGIRPVVPLSGGEALQLVESLDSGETLLVGPSDDEDPMPQQSLEQRNAHGQKQLLPFNGGHGPQDVYPQISG